MRFSQLTWSFMEGFQRRHNTDIRLNVASDIKSVTGFG